LTGTAIGLFNGFMVTFRIPSFAVTFAGLPRGRGAACARIGHHQPPSAITDLTSTFYGAVPVTRSR
jgi:ABC-type xylose transport system permease subunit